MENPNGRGGGYDYGNPRAWGDNAFWKFRRQGGVIMWKPSMAWYGYFLELPILQQPGVPLLNLKMGHFQNLQLDIV